MTNDERKGELHIREVPLDTKHKLRAIADMLEARRITPRRSMPDALTYAVQQVFEQLNTRSR
jgi:hypothetical protein